MYSCVKVASSLCTGYFIAVYCCIQVQVGEETLQVQCDQSAAERLSPGALHADITCIHDNFRYKYHVIQDGREIHVTHPASGNSFWLGTFSHCGDYL